MNKDALAVGGESPTRRNVNFSLFSNPSTSATPQTQLVPRSNALHEASQDINVGLQMLTTVSNGNIIGNCTLLTAQAIVSMQTFFHHPDKITRLQLTVHGVQSLLLCTMLALLLTDAATHPHANDITNSNYTHTRELLASIFQGILLVNWGPTRVKSFINVVKNRGGNTQLQPDNLLPSRASSLQSMEEGAAGAVSLSMNPSATAESKS